MSKYKVLGVNVRKEGVKVFKGVVDELFPGAFCVVTEDPDAPGWGLVSHTDSAGSKPVTSYLCWRESGDPAWFRGLAQDVLAMNLDDIVCVAARPISFVDYVAFNTLLIDRVELLRALSEGFAECFGMLKGNGMPILFGGGETADMPDQLRTLDVSGALFGKVDLSKAVSGNAVEDGDAIVGLRSGGPLRYEEAPNSGIMCNGGTLARNCLLRHEYIERYPELAHPSRDRFTGRYGWDDHVDELGMTVAEAILSPTRLFAPVVAQVLERLGPSVHGMVHNTGGGQTKCLNLGDGIRYMKEQVPEPDPIFHLIQREGEVEWREMYEDFNMGVGFELVVEKDAVETVLSVADGFEIGAQVLGRCEKVGGGNSLEIDSPYGKWVYS